MTRNDRLRDNLLLRVLLPMGAVLLISGLIGYIQAFTFVTSSYDRALLEDARGLAQQVKVEHGKVKLELPEAAIEILRANTNDRVYYQVRFESGAIVAGDAELPQPPHLNTRTGYYDTSIRGENVRVVVMTLAHLVDKQSVLVQIGETRRKTDQLAVDIVVAVVAPQLILMALAWVAIRRGVSKGLQPLEQLAEMIERRSPDDLAPLPTSDVPQETQALLLAFNALLEKLGDANQAQKRFVADAAHQLRTPLAALRIQLERALREPDPDTRELLFQQLVGGIERTARLSSQLLLLARAEPGAVPLGNQTVDLCALAFEIGSRWVPRALSAGRDLGLSADEHPVVVRGDSIMLGEVVNNFLDNAIRYGGAHITLRVEAKEGSAILSVEDDGQGVPSGEEARVFERFHRAPGSGGEGSGLGLAIVREIARGFGGDAGYEKRDGLSAFFICLPLLPTEQGGVQESQPQTGQVNT